MPPREGSRDRPAALQAVLFDMDGVVTDTARAHAAAWKRLFDEYLRRRADRLHEEFRPFDSRSDYREYVDGKPRGDGIRSFLESRGIELPTGDRDDGPDEETVCGLGNRKDRYFHEWLDANPVRAYPGTLRLLDDLRTAGVPSAVFSSSRNAEAVLHSAGVLDRFDARVDGEDRARLDIPGKPAPDILLEAALRLGAAPGDSAVFEDAIAGIQAAIRGGFGLAIGVARGNVGDELTGAGADIVVHDLSELRFSPGTGLTVKTLANLPSAWHRQDEIEHSLADRKPAVFLDYDGTLTPIVEDHTQALLDDDMRSTVAALARHCAVIIVSGRDLARLRELVALDCVWYAGSHGFEITGPEGTDQRLSMGEEFLPELDEAERKLGDRLAEIEGCALERKRYSIAVHYRRVADTDVQRVGAVVDEVLAEHPRLYRGHGKKVFELRPDIDWDKGRAVLWLLEHFDTATVPIYVGDDITDEDAFHVLTGQGLCIAVRHEETRPTAADYAVADPPDVQRLLQWLTGIATQPNAGSGGAQ